ncbi:MAG: hypothetical protein ACI9SJ_000533 [Flavobacteriaceae bacterium]|jgi:hypothetical protein|uniref:hypothetical protein n=1 Tax=Candidatus Marifrigoribacter sp. Uisw_064 TaxID=3230970 RepID=UPI003AEA3E55
MIRSFIYYKNKIVLVHLKKLLQYFPGLFIFIQKVRYKGKGYGRKIITKNTDIVIEGYPRSANSFSVKAFKFDNAEGYKIATHLHAYPQVIVGVKHNIPTLLLIRNPFDCVVSYMALLAQAVGFEKINKGYNIEWLLKDYVLFYKKLLPYKDKVVVGVFSDVLTDYGNVINEVNNKFNTKFELFEHSQENVNKVFSSSKSHLSPSGKREDVKNSFVEQMEQLKSTRLFEEAESLYLEWSTTKNIK